MIIRGAVEQLDPGSRAGRYFGGFGAGSASTKMNVDIVDAKSGKVLAHVTQTRRSGGTFKMGGGNDLDVLYVTSAIYGRDAKALAGQTKPGGLFVIRGLDTRGVPRDRRAISCAPPSSISTPRIPAERWQIVSKSSCG